jgi:hypothetical protein
MQRCPKCGYSEGKDWPGMLLIVAFGVVSVVAVGNSSGKVVHYAAAIGMFLFAASALWRAVREDKNRVECSRLDFPVRERPKKI